MLHQFLFPYMFVLCSGFELLLKLLLLNISDKIQILPTKRLHVYMFMYTYTCIYVLRNVCWRATDGTEI